MLLHTKSNVFHLGVVLKIEDCKEKSYIQVNMVYIFIQALYGSFPQSFVLKVGSGNLCHILVCSSMCVQLT